MNIVSDLDEWRRIRNQLNGKSIGLVHTMGNLHAGHMSLCARAKAENDISVMCIFVNPTQFNQVSDFEKYPKTLEQDIAMLKLAGIDYLFAPDASAMYADHYQMQIAETEISKELEGEFRPGHFTGVLTIVAKVFNLVQPTRSYWGAKDFQQQLLVKKMVTSLFMPIDIITCDTVRAEDDVALSSRNSRLSAEQRKLAANIPRLLQSVLSLEKITQELSELGFKVEYVVEKWQRRLAAVWLGEVRLIDNMEI